MQQKRRIFSLAQELGLADLNPSMSDFEKLQSIASMVGMDHFDEASMNELEKRLLAYKNKEDAEFFRESKNINRNSRNQNRLLYNPQDRKFNNIDAKLYSKDEPLEENEDLEDNEQKEKDEQEKQEQKKQDAKDEGKNTSKKITKKEVSNVVKTKAKALTASLASNPIFWVVVACAAVFVFLIILLGGDISGSDFDPVCDFNRSKVTLNVCGESNSQTIELKDYVFGVVNSLVDVSSYPNEALKALMIVVKTNALSNGSYNNTTKNLSLDDCDFGYEKVDGDNLTKLNNLYDSIANLIYINSSYSGTITSLSSGDALSLNDSIVNNLETLANSGNNYENILSLNYKGSVSGSSSGGTQNSFNNNLNVDELLKNMTLEEKIGQMIIYNVSGKGTVANQSLLDNLKAVKPGGIIVFANNISSDVKQLNDLVDDINTTASIPLIWSIDQEGGLVQRINPAENISSATAIPPMFEVGKTNDEKYAYNVGRVVGEEIGVFGFNMDFAPSLDIWNNSNNTVIGNRAFGTTAGVVSNMGVAFGKGLESTGVTAVYKHFPGHGNTEADSHYSLPVVNKSKIDLLTEEIVPFKNAINNGAKVIMIGHLAVPNITGDDTPASLSKELITNFLKTDLGYKGLVVTDALNMDGLYKNVQGDIIRSTKDVYTMAINAGVDLLLGPADASVAIQQIKDAINNGNIDESKIDESVRKILTYKNTMKTTKNDQSLLGSSEHKQIIDRTITDFSNNNSTASNNSNTNNSSTNSVPNTNETIFVGDSRTNGMRVAGVIPDDKSVYAGGHGYSWFVGDTKPESRVTNSVEGGEAGVDKILEDGKNYNIVLWLGVNDVTKNGIVDKYIDKYTELATGKWKNHNLYVVKVGPVDDSKSRLVKQKEVDSLNANMKKLVEERNIPNLKYLDIEYNISFEGTDGVHYTKADYQKIHDAIIESIESSGSHFGNTSYNGLSLYNLVGNCQMIQSSSSGKHYSGGNCSTSTEDANLLTFIKAWESPKDFCDSNNYKAVDIGDGTVTAGYGITNWVIGDQNYMKAYIEQNNWQQYFHSSNGGYRMNINDCIPIKIIDDIKEYAIEMDFKKLVENELEKQDVTLTDYQTDALISLAYNCRNCVIKAISSYKSDGYEGLWNTIKNFLYDTKGKFYPGLKKRRKGEFALFVTGDYTDQGLFYSRTYPPPDYDNYDSEGVMAREMNCSSNSFSKTGLYNTPGCTDYKQYDNRWGSIPIGTKQKTMKQIGCAVTSIAIGITCRGAQTTIPNFDAGEFIKALNKEPNKHFAEGNLIRWETVKDIAPSIELEFNSNGSNENISSNEVKKEIIKKYDDEDHFIIVFFRGTDGNGVGHTNHYVVYNGFVDDNTIKTIDPNSKEETEPDYSNNSLKISLISQIVVYKVIR